jgi:TetR/AcrR family transcriptional regulator, transcriptional repressor for nem operon
MVNGTSDRPKLTARGAEPRAQIAEEAAALIHERGVAATTLEDVKVAAELSGSQMHHCFPGKNELVQAVTGYQADTIVKHNRQALGSPRGVGAWRKTVVTGVRSTNGKGGCPLGSLGDRRHFARRRDDPVIPRQRAHRPSPGPRAGPLWRSSPTAR